jgi:hypothetical protein
MERYELHGVKVYQLDICEAIEDHHLCPGMSDRRGFYFLFIGSEFAADHGCSCHANPGQSCTLKKAASICCDAICCIF